MNQRMASLDSRGGVRILHNGGVKGEVAWRAAGKGGAVGADGAADG